MGLGLSSVAPTKNQDEPLGKNFVIDMRAMIIDNCRYIKPDCHPLLVLESDTESQTYQQWATVVYDGRQELIRGPFCKSLELALQLVLDLTARMALNKSNLDNGSDHEMEAQKMFGSMHWVHLATENG